MSMASFGHAMLDMEEFKENMPCRLYRRLSTALKNGHEHAQQLQRVQRVPVLDVLTDDMRLYTMRYIHCEAEIGSTDPGALLDVKMEEHAVSFVSTNKFMEDSRIFEVLRGTIHQQSTAINSTIWDSLCEHVKAYATLKRIELRDHDIPDVSDLVLVRSNVRILSIIDVMTYAA